MSKVGLSVVALLVWTLPACGRDSSAAQLPAQGDARDSVRFIAHLDHVPAGFALSVRPWTLRNPHEGNERARTVGSQLFVSYNCVDCHGADGAGAIGPSLQDGRWRYGGTAAELFESIYQGRSEGMPAWGGRIADDQIWMLVTYLRALPTKDLSTENFTGRTVERSGH